MRQFSLSRPCAEKYNKDGAYGGMIRHKSDMATSIFNKPPYHLTYEKNKKDRKEEN